MAKENPSKPPPRDPRDFLPLKPDVFLILTILAHGDRHGYAIMRSAETWTEGGMEIQAGALYRRLKWMMNEGLIREVDPTPGIRSATDRRRDYGITSFGRVVAREEARRMAELLAAAREAELVSGTEGA